jgi:hypothetical protein
MPDFQTIFKQCLLVFLPLRRFFGRPCAKFISFQNSLVDTSSIFLLFCSRLVFEKFLLSKQSHLYFNMGRAPAWLPEESEAASIAWIRATNNGIEGVEQRGSDFRSKVHNYMKAYSPSDAEENHYAGRGPKAVLDHLRTKVFSDIQKFNECLRQIQSSSPTGCNNDNIYNMAVALHLKQADRLNYNFRDFDSAQWPYFLAWKVLRNTPKFRLPSPKTTAVVAAAEAAAAEAATTPSFLSNSSCFTEALTGRDLSRSHSGVGDDESVAEPPSLITQQPFVDKVELPTAPQLPLGVSSFSLTPSVSSLLPLSSMDPSRGGRGSSMGRTKAKRELERERRSSDKVEELKKIRFLFEKQTKEQVRTGKMIQYKQVMSVAVDPEDARMRKKVKNKMFKMILEEDDGNDDDDDDDIDDNNNNNNNNTQAAF